MTYFNIRHQYGRNLYVSKGSLGSVISYYVLNDMPYHIVATKTDTLVEALLMINQLPFPRELIDIIKDYVYYDYTHVLQSFLKSQLIMTLYTMDVSYRLIRNR